VQAKYLHWPVKSVIPLGILDIKVIVSYVIDTLRAIDSRYFSVAVKRINGEELNVPVVDALVSPK
jgi:hypothetical protein